MLLDGKKPAEVESRVHDLADVLERRLFHALIVTNEVGLGIVPESSLGRMFRDVAGLEGRRPPTILNPQVWEAKQRGKA